MSEATVINPMPNGHGPWLNRIALALVSAAMGWIGSAWTMLQEHNIRISVIENSLSAISRSIERFDRKLDRIDGKLDDNK